MDEKDGNMACANSNRDCLRGGEILGNLFSIFSGKMLAMGFLGSVTVNKVHQNIRIFSICLSFGEGNDHKDRSINYQKSKWEKWITSWRCLTHTIRKKENCKDGKDSKDRGVGDL